MTIDNYFNPVMGIDLGTTFSAIAKWDGRGPKSYKNNKCGTETWQSAVYYDPQNKPQFLIGTLGYKKGLLKPENLALGVKRHMDDASFKVSLDEEKFSPIQLSSEILKRIYDDVQYDEGTDEQTGVKRLKSRGTVVTVPYYFKAHQCENTRQAAELADINCIGILQEPIAASLSYVWQLVQNNPEKEFQENILVFDLGGGTFDLTLFKLEQTKEKLLFEVLATGGNDRLGGIDFDECLAKLILEKSGISLEGLEERQKRQARQKLIESVINTKISLSATEKTYVTIPDVIPGQHIDIEISRSEFEESIEHYLDKIESIIEKLWFTARMETSAVDRVILVGGSSKIPCMKSLLWNIIGEYKVYSNIDPSLCVAEGAAMYAAYLDDQEVFGREIEIRTRTCHALGVATFGDKFEVIIPANLKTPCQRKKLFIARTIDVEKFNISVYQGSASLIKNNSLVGTLTIPNPPQKEELRIEVTFKVSEQQTVSVTVTIEETMHNGTFTFA